MPCPTLYIIVADCYVDRHTSNDNWLPRFAPQSRIPLTPNQRLWCEAPAAQAGRNLVVDRFNPVLKQVEDHINKPSRLFGDDFPVPLDGKTLILAIATAFAEEVNASAQQYIKETGGDPANWNSLIATGAFPTAKQHCPRIVVTRTGGSNRIAGLGGVVDIRRITLPDNDWTFKLFSGQLVTDNIEVTLCCLNDLMRDNFFVWWQQYVLDGLAHLIPILRKVSGVFECRATGGTDDTVIYQATQDQPGFQFYVASTSIQVSYDLVVAENVDRIKEIINWQVIAYPDGTAI